MNDAIKSRMTRDNFWNILTWVAMPLCALISAECGTLWGGVIGSFTLVPYILARFNKISFDPSCNENTPLNEVKVFNKQGNSLSMHLPFKFDLVKGRIILNIVFFPILISIFPSGLLTAAIILFALLWWPMSYFIVNNIPVSAFFNAKAWDYNEVLFVADNDTKRKHHDIPRSTTSDYVYRSSPTYSHLPYNIHHHRK